MMPQKPQQQLITDFQQRFDTPPSHFICSPGRVNLIGGHTDYNQGWVMPLAINYAISMAMRPRHDQKINLYALNFDQNNHYQIDLETLEKSGTDWDEYVKGTAWSLKEHYQQALLGFDAVIHGDIPIGAGLSSSAAFELLIARALTLSNQLDWQAVAMAECCQRAENEWIGVNCGIMDQLIIATAKKDHACLIDCRSLERQHLLLPRNTAIVVMDTGTRRTLVDSGYNDRRQRCQQVAQQLGIKVLRDASLTDLKKIENELEPESFHCAYHVISENKRVLQAKQAMLNNDAQTLGKLISSSHDSLSQNFKVSNEALDTMVSLAIQHTGCYGARMTGAGFGGCAVALIDNRYAKQFIHDTDNAYQTQQQLKPSLYLCTAEEGVHSLALNS